MTAPVMTTSPDQLEVLAREIQQALETDPDNPALLHQLGSLLGKLGQTDLEMALIGQALARDPANAGYHADLGFSLQSAGHVSDAEEAFRHALALAPAHPDAASGLADILLDRGEGDRALALMAGLGEAGRLTDRVLGRLAAGANRWDESIDRLVRHLGQWPTDAAALFYLGVALQANELLEPAAAAYRQAVLFDPNLFEGHANLTTVLSALGRTDEALAPAERAVALAPERPGAYLNRSNARHDAGDLDGAKADLERAVALAPDYAEAWSTLGNLHHDLGDLGAARAAHERAVALAPELPQTRWNRSFSLLASGHLGEGWDEYEWRRETVAARPEPRDFPWNVWGGEALLNRRILVWREQGLGDELLFLTCVPDLIAEGARVTLLVSPRLVTMVRRAFPGADVREDQAGSAGLGEFDFQIGLGSLPGRVRRTRSAFPASGAFLKAEGRHTRKWAERLAALGRGPKVGICWRSGLVTPDRARHYPPSESLGALLGIPGITWINLQYDDCAAELDALEARYRVRVRRWAGEDLKNDLESVLGLLGTLHAVVTAPTAVSSLAGAVGAPTWQMDSGSDWTTFGEASSPWFPSIRVVGKRPADRNWDPVLAEIRSGVERLKVSKVGAEN